MHIFLLAYVRRGRELYGVLHQYRQWLLQLLGALHRRINLDVEGALIRQRSERGVHQTERGSGLNHERWDRAKVHRRVLTPHALNGFRFGE